MKKIVLSLAFLFTAFQFATAQIPVLGIYQNTTIIAAGGNAMVTPMAAPTNAASITAYTSTSFKGILQVNPTTGIVTITNANPAGTYTIYVKAFNGTASAINNFTLTVNNTLCSQGLFRAAPDVVVPSGPGCIAVGDFNNDGKQDMVMASSNSNNAIIRLGDGSGNFTAVANVIIGGGGQSVATADFNGDGNADFATTNNNNTVSVRLGNGLGGFTGTTNFAVGTNPTSIAIGDFNGDGKADFAIANTNSINVSIRLGDGVGGFSGTTNITIGYSPYTVAIGDFNGDGKADFVTGNISNNTVSVCLGDGTGGFGGVNNITVGQIPNSLAIGDFNADGKQDLAMANSSTNTIFIRLGDGAGSFSGTASAIVGNAPNLVATGDFNGDGKLDVAALNLNSNSVSICLGNGSGGISAVKSTILSPYFSYPSSLAVGDFNNDGRQDFASGITSTGPPVFIRLGGENEINVKGNNVDINDGDDTTSATDGTDFGTLIGNKTVRTFSIQNTGSVNLAISNIVLSGTDTALFKVDSITLPATIAAGASVTFKLIFIPTTDGLKTATINILNDDCNESVYDFKIQGTGATPVLGSYAATTILTAGGNGMVMPAAPPANAATISAYTTSKFKGILQVNPTTGLLTIINAHPAGTYLITVKAFNGLLSSVTTSFTLTVSNPLCSQAQFTAKPNLYIGGTVSGIAISDFNNDNKQDFVTCVPELNSITIRLGDGAGGFITSPYIAVGASPYTVTTGDFNGDGKQDIATANYTQATVSISLGNGSGSFNTTTNISVAGSPISIATGDFNADGKPDIATASYANSLVSIRLGNGAGTFTGTTEIPVGTNPYAVVIGDFNNDDKPDLITANYNSANVSVRIGDGAGGFNGAINIPVGSGPRGVATGDFNGDGKPDFATANFGGGSVSIRLGDGTGGFTATTSLSTSGTNYALAIGDFNMDNKQDIATSNNVSSSVSIYTGNGAGGFSGPANVFVGANPRAIITGDFNGDNIPDFATASAGNNAISIRLSNGAGIYNSAADVLVNSPFGMAVGDFDGDGRQDMAIATPGGNVAVRMAGINEIDVQGNNTSIADGDNTPSASDSTDFGSGGSITRNFTIKNTGQVNLTINSVRMSGADSAMFRVSGILNATIIAVGTSRTFTISFTPTGSLGLKTSTVKITNNDCDEALYDFVIQGTAVATTIAAYPATVLAAGSITTVIPSATPANAISITAVTSTNFKGLLHVNPVTGAVTITNAQPAGVYTVTIKAFNGVSTATTSFALTINNAVCSQGLYTSATNAITGNAPFSITVADFNNDGITDFATANYQSSSISIRLGNGSGGFTAATEIALNSNPYVIVAGDVNGDGKQDLLVGTYNSYYVSALLGNGLGGFSGSGGATVGLTPYAIAIGDFNGDGLADIAVCNNPFDNVSIRLGDGTGRFTGSAELTVGYSPRSVAISDFNGDGKQDLAIAAGSGIAIRLGDGTGGFTGTTSISIGSPLVINDFNGDGKPDIAAIYDANTVAVRLGDGTGGFAGTTSVSVGKGPVSITTADYNGDGKQDFATVNNTANTLSVRLGDGTGNFATTPDIPVASGPTGVATGDFNGDGRFDLLAGEDYGNVVSIRLNTTNEINVVGNNITITDGDTTPDSTDYTHFGTTVVNGSSLVRNFTIQNTSPVNVKIDSIRITGTDAPQFVLSSISLPVTIAPGASKTLTITFTPTSAGFKKAILNIYNDDCDEALYDFAIQANTTIPPALGTYPAITAVTGSSIVINHSFSPGYYPSLTASTSTNFKGLLTINPATGKLTVTNAHPAGIYTITVGVPGATTSFVLTVNKPNCSQGEFSTAINTGVGNGPQAIAIADFNNDGKPDVATANFTANNVSIRLGNGAGGFTGTTTIAVGAGPKSIAVADFNGDGNADFATANYNTNTVSIRYGNGLGNFNDTLELVVGTSVYAIAATDFNGDGKVDFAVTYYNRLQVSIRLGNGAGGFFAAPDVAVGQGTTSIATGDFNDDGKPDFVTANLLGNSISVRLGNGLGGFTGTTDLASNTNPQTVIITDFNNDGKQDLATANPGLHQVQVRLGDGAGGFGNIISSTNFGTSPYAIVAGDFNGDGKQDLAATNQNSANVSVRLGNGSGNFTVSANITVGGTPQSIAAVDVNEDGRQDILTGNFFSNTISTALSIEREINVKGNNTNIVSGDTSPIVANYTDFGSVAIGSNLTRTYTIYNTGTVDLIINNITISGPDSIQFMRGNLALLAVIPAGDSLSFNITFAPGGNGSKNARVKIFSDDCDETLYDFAIRGTASCSPSSTNNVWLGISADWNLASNWSLNFVPSECAKVVINTGVPFMPEITSPSSACYSLSLNNGAVITVKTGGHLNITANN